MTARPQVAAREQEELARQTCDTSVLRPPTRTEVFEMTRDAAAPDGFVADEIIAGIDQGRTIPAWSYTDPSLFEHERRRIFDRCWQYVGHSDQLQETGSYLTGRVGRIPVVVVRDAAGALAGFVNVCAHRGHEVAIGSGCRRSFQCHYHGWTYGLDGQLKAAPRSQREPAFDRDAIALRPIQVDTWGPLVFVNPDLSAAPLAETLAGLPELAGRRGLRLDDHRPRARREWPIEANWKVTLDNNTECYHCATVHPGFSAGYHVDADNYEVTEFARSFSHRSPPKSGGVLDGSEDYHLYYVWPNFMLSARGNDHYYVYVYDPVSPSRTLQINEYYFPPERSESEVEAEIELLRGLMSEDWAVFESVQRGMASGMVERGHLLYEQESLLRHFQTLWAESIG